MIFSQKLSGSWLLLVQKIANLEKAGQRRRAMAVEPIGQDLFRDTDFLGDLFLPTMSVAERASSFISFFMILDNHGRASGVYIDTFDMDEAFQLAEGILSPLLFKAFNSFKEGINEPLHLRHP